MGGGDLLVPGKTPNAAPVVDDQKKSSAMPRVKLVIGCLLATVITGGGAGLAGVDPVTAGIIGFGTAGLLFVLFVRKSGPDR